MQMSNGSLKILTLDGGGLQALTTLSILGEICKAIALQNGSSRTPAPYELFDIICGIGTGGWLALLLGRYRLDVPSCTALYMEMATAIDPLMSSPRSRPKDKGFRLDQDQLIAKVQQVLSRYGLKEEILDEALDEKVRCKHVFVAGAVLESKEQGQKYRLFRTYDPEKGRSGREGPDPRSCKVWEAISATGAAKHFLKPYRFGGAAYFDENVPTPHPISRLALDEAQQLFGDQVPISIILNIGPGIPDDQDVQQLEQSAEGPFTKLVRTFSWPNKKSWKQLLKRDTQVSSKSASGFERGLEEGIRTRLQEVYGPDGAERYYHLGPDFAASRLSLNDVSAIERSSESAREVLARSKGKIQDAARQYWVSTPC